jgi:NTP pyrophosphatase (non-canonical NTP hydrolase)
MDDLNFAELRRANRERCERHYHAISAWSLMDWLGAVTGELGEAAGVIKNIRRRDEERERNGHAIPAATIDALADECADVVIYLDLLCARAGIDLGAAVRRKFNRVSRERLDSPIVLEREQ